MTTRTTLASLALLSFAGLALPTTQATAQNAHDLAHPTPALTVVAANEAGTGHGHGGMQLAQHAGVTVESAFARASAGPAKNGAAYLTIRNAGDSADRLVAASTPVADRAELHTHLKDGDVMKMRAIEAVEVPADGMAMLAPGGDHLMLMGLKAPLKEGESFPITLVFEKAGEMTVTVAVGGVGAMEGQSGSGHHGSHDMKKKSN